MPIHITSELILKLFFLGILFYITWTDLKYRTISNRCIIVAILIRFLYFLITKEGNWRAFLWLIFNGLLVSVPVLLLTLLAEAVLKKGALGGGDIKLLFALGVYLGPAKSLLMLLIACLCGIIEAAIAIKQSKNRESTAFPFGPCLAVGAAVSLFFGDSIITWYLLR